VYFLSQPGGQSRPTTIGADRAPRVHIGGHTRFVVDLVAKAHSRIRAAGENNR